MKLLRLITLGLLMGFVPAILATDPDVSLVNIPGATGTPATPINMKVLTATSGATVTADTNPGGNAIVIPAGYNSLAVYVGEVPLAKERVRLQCKIDSTTTPIDVFTYGHVIVQAPAGTTVAFGAQYQNRNSATVSDAAQDITVIPYVMPATLADPTDTTVTVTPDRSFPAVWSISSAHLVMPAENDVFKVKAATKARDIFIQEYGGGTNLLPTRHVHLPAGQAVRIQTRYRIVALMSIEGEPLEIVGNYGIRGGNTSTTWEPSFTVVKSATVNSILGFKNAMNDPTINEIVMQPGFYDLSTSGYQVNSTNYATAFTKSMRIRSSTNDPDSVVFMSTNTYTGSQWQVALSSGKSWIFKGVSWNYDGCAIDGPGTGMLNFTGPVHLINCKYYGASAQVVSGGTHNAADTSIKWLSSSTTGAITVYAAWCDFRKSNDDMLAANVQNSQAITAHIIGSYLDGNGTTQNNQQLVTNHSGGVMVNWGCQYGNLTTGGVSRVASDAESSPAYLMYCRAYPENFTGASSGGIDVPGSNLVNASFMHFCDFQAFISCDGMKTIVRSNLKGTKSLRPLMSAATAVTSRVTGCDMYIMQTGGAGSERCIDCLSNGSGGANVTIVGTRFTGYSETANQGILRLFYNTGSATTTVSATNCLFRANAGASPTPLFELNTGATQAQILQLKNCLFATGNTDATQSVSSAASNQSTAANCYFQQNAATANWSTAFPSPSNVTFSRTAPATDANDIPIKSGNVDAGTTAVVGSLDIYGRPFLGGSWVIGAAERQEIRSGAILYPALWVAEDTETPTTTPTVKAPQNKVYELMSGTGRSRACSTSGPIALIVEEPAGSVVVLQYSADEGKTWSDVPNNGGNYTISTAVSGVINNRGPMQYAFRCISYGGVPFHVVLAGN